jgi:A/G-specific adenine glycosylase
MGHNDGTARRLLAWYRRHRRALPWRAPGNAGDPYRVWVSEVMLQQTQVAVVIPYYERFVRAFPDVAALAGAPEAAVLAAWSGLGYYRRARALHAAARAIVDHHGGALPLSYAALTALPGIGAYTAGAVLSIAAGQALPAVDGNVIRIVSRLAGRHLTPSAVTAQVHAWLPSRHPGDFNQALMDLGATICLPRQPACGRCPLRGQCAARAELPPLRPRSHRHQVERHYALIRRGGRVFLRQRPARAARLSGMWELLPLPAAPPTPAPLATLRHAITSHAITASVYAAPVRGMRGEPGRWFSQDQLADVPLTGLARKFLQAALGWTLTSTSAPAGARSAPTRVPRAAAASRNSATPSAPPGDGGSRRRR